METLLSDPFLFGEEILNQMHLFTGGWFDILMIAITTTGNQIFYVLFLPLCYWLYDTKLSLKIGTVFLVSATINDMTKEIYQNPRPDPANLLEGIRQLNLSYKPHSPGFPSGHTQGAVSLWGAALYFINKKWVRILSVMLIILIPYSRIYLGVHYLGDVIGGYVLGLICLLTVIPLIILVQRNYLKVNTVLTVSFLVIVPLVIFYIIPGHGINQTMGVLSGMLLGAFFGEERIDFNPRNSILPNIIKIFLGLAGVFIIKEGMKLVLPSIPMSGYFRYWLIGFWVAFGAPLIFSKIKILRGNTSS